MAIVQISQITNRKGLEENLPQLAGAEFGWSVDTRQLYIGNGTLEEGAPVIGNTEILTEFSDVLQFQTAYIYKGQAAGYTVVTGPTSNDPVTQSLQSWLDQFATVKDFGAVGDGTTDDTAAINRALYQLYCREVNPQIRRSLFFPAGVYRVTGTIKIPTYATLYGEGLNNSVIQMDDGTGLSYVAATCDSLQQTGVNIGTNDAAPPAYITITNMGFRNLDPLANVVLVEDADTCRFQSVGFFGPLTTTQLTSDILDTASVRFASTSSLITNQIVFDDCKFSGTVFGINTDQQVQGITVSNSILDTLYQGIVLGTGTPVNGGATGFRIVGNMFNNIYAEGVVFGAVSLNATGHNIFYGVGNHFGTTTSPFTAVIDIQSNNNISISDLFERSDAYAGPIIIGTSYPRIVLNNTVSISTTNGSQLALGNYVRQSGQRFTLVDNTSSAATIGTFSTDIAVAFKIDYTIVRDVTTQTGTYLVATQSVYTGTVTTNLIYAENASTGITLSFSQTDTVVSFEYVSTNTGIDGILTYSLTYLS